MTNKNIDSEIGMIKTALDSLTDEVIASRNGGNLLVHHIDGNPQNKLVIGTVRMGKHSIPNNPERV